MSVTPPGGSESSLLPSMVSVTRKCYPTGVHIRYDEEVVSWCAENRVAVTPGCATPTKIMMALKHGLTVLKFFPANIYGGIKALKSLSGPFSTVRFIPTGGVSNENAGEFAAAPFIHAVGGSWVCPKADIVSGSFEKITALSKEARKAYLGYETAHIGINSENEASSLFICKMLENTFGFETKTGNSPNFSSSSIEVMKSPYPGCNGHIAVRTNNMNCAVADLASRGFAIDPDTIKKKGDRITAVYLKDEIGGFAVHLLAKQ